jgi:hypothetical protein
MTVLSPLIGGIMLLASAISIIAMFGLTLSGVTGILGVLTVILSVVAGVSALVSAFSPPVLQTQPVRVVAGE